MSRKAILLLVLLPVLACRRDAPDRATPSEESVATAEAIEPYTLNVTFAGLIAFAKAQLQGRPVVWALLPDAKYIPGSHASEDLPPCIGDEGPSIGQLRARVPPHHPALRFTGATVDLDGVPVDVSRPFLIDEKDLRIATGVPGPGTTDDVALSTKEELFDVRGGAVGDYAAFDVVANNYIDSDGRVPERERFLIARVLIDFGTTFLASPLNCEGATLQYGFKTPAENGCTNPVARLAEEIEVTQSTTQPVTITLLPGNQVLKVRPATPGGKVTVEVLNVMEEALGQHTDPCSELSRQHLEAYRWFYRLLANAGSCDRHFFPCRFPGGESDFGGDRCPVKGLG